jgi:hypothetical protein
MTAAAINAAVHKTIVDAIAAGETFAEAASRAGVHRVTLASWLARGADEELGPYADLHLAVTRARATLHRELLDVVKGSARGTDVGGGDWKAAAFLLERRFRSVYGTDAKEDAAPDRTKSPMPRDTARDLAKKGRLRSVGGGKR